MENKIHNLILILLLAVLLIFGIWNLSKSPATWFDEGINLGIAKSLLSHGIFSLEVAPGEFVETRQFLITSNYPVLLSAALSMKIFGFNLLAARSPMVLFLFLFTLTAYFLVKKLYGKTAALMSVALVVSFTPFYGNGKAVLGEIPGLFYFLVGLLLLKSSREFFCGFGSEQAWFFREAKNCEAHTPSFVAGRNEESKNTARLDFIRRTIFAGFFIGLSAATKPFFLIVPAAIFIAEIFHPLGNLVPKWKRIAILAAGGALPMVAWLYTILPSFSITGLWSAVFYYSNSYASTNFDQLIFQNFLRFFTESTPIHFAALFLVCAIFLIWKKWNGENLEKAEIALAIFVLLTLAFYLKTPGWYRYFFPAHTILFLIFPAALMRLGGKKVAALAVIPLFVFQIVFTVNQRNTSLYYSDEAEVFSKYVMDTTTPQDKILFINGPSAAFLTNNRQIYQHLQINPVLSFGRTDARNYDYIALQGAPIEAFSDALESNYKIQKQVGHYILYRKINF